MVDSAELQPTNPSVELITRSLLKTQTRLFTLELGSADISKLFKFWTTPPPAQEAETPRSVLLQPAHLAPLHQPQEFCCLDPLSFHCLVLYCPPNKPQYRKAYLKKPVPLSQQRTEWGSTMADISKPKPLGTDLKSCWPSRGVPTKQRVFKGILEVLI